MRSTNLVFMDEWQEETYCSLKQSGKKKTPHLKPSV